VQLALNPAGKGFLFTFWSSIIDAAANNQVIEFLEIQGFWRHLFGLRVVPFVLHPSGTLAIGAADDFLFNQTLRFARCFWAHLVLLVCLTLL
jgi:hypothetical protein